MKMEDVDLCNFGVTWGILGVSLVFWQIIILLMSSNNQIYEFQIPNIYNYFFNNIRLMHTLCFLVASVKLKVYKKVVKFSFKQQKILGIRNS